MLIKTWGGVLTALIATFSLALGISSNASAKAEPEIQSSNLTSANLAASSKIDASPIINSTTNLIISQSPSQNSNPSSTQALSQKINSISSPTAQSNSLSSASSASKTSSVLKVGETRSQSLARSKEDTVAKIHAHSLKDKTGKELVAATVYVRNIPVLTFVSQSDAITTSGLKFSSNHITSIPPASSTPVERATVTAALLNQLNSDGFDGSTITPAWNSGKYIIKMGSKATIQFDQGLILPNTTNNQAEDTLQAANLLRRLMGNAEPVKAVSGAPNLVPDKIVFSATQFLSGLASWYGPGLQGNMSANGEMFNQNALTAAHRSLPFGTKVRVTNVQSGQSVVVRITDRGPFEYSRVIDLSTAAAKVIGLIGAGVGQVKLEVLQASQY
jgi:rare lipoprotein A